MAGLTLRNICKSFGKTDVIKGIDLDIQDGEFIVFVGPSGCGKSTLLRLIAGLEDITSGELQIGGRIVNDLEPNDRQIAMVFQSYAIFPHMSVWENMAFGLTIRKESKTEIDRRVNEAARILHMESLLDRRPSQLSGGQRQRVAIGRAIARAPEVFLFDEPLSNLDAALRMNTRKEIAELHRRLGTTMIYVTHDQVEAMTLADRIVVLNEGEIQQFGKPMDLFHKPVNRFVAQFIGSPPMNFFDARVIQTDGVKSLECTGIGTLPLRKTELEIGRSVTIGIRPQYLSLVQSQYTDISFTAMTEYAERLGGETVVGLKLAIQGSSDEQSVVALLPEDIEIRLGFATTLYFDSRKLILFDR
jgi:multiple sugar transport system ATP-binding protein